MKLLFLGTGEFGIPALDALRAAGHEILAAISQPDRPAGRQRIVKPTPIHAHVARLGVRHLQVEDVNSQLPEELLAAAELGVVVAFGQKLSAALLRRLPRGFVNIHASLLPRFRGAAPIQWAIIGGETETGVTTFGLDERWDNGPIWGRRTCPIAEDVTADELHDRLALIGGELIVESLVRIASGTATPEAQNAAGASRAPKLTRADGELDWTQPARVIARRINGLWSWPAATCLFAARNGRRERVQLARARADVTETTRAGCVPGELGRDHAIGTGDGWLRLLEVKPEGGRLMSFEAFANGRHVAAGDRFLPLDAP